MEVQNGQRTRGVLIGFCEADEIKNLQTPLRPRPSPRRERKALPARPPPNKFEGATPLGTPYGAIKLDATEY